MGFKSFFKKIGNGIKSVATKVKDGIVKGFNWVKDKGLPAVSRITHKFQPILEGIARIPGKAGMFGKVASGITEGINAISNLIPNKQVRDKIQEGTSKVDSAVDRGVTAVQDGAGKLHAGLNNGARVIGNWADKANDLLNKQMKNNM